MVNGSSATRLSLILRVRDDDADAWSELVDLYSPLIAYWCRRYGIAPDNVGDLTQEIFFAVSRSIDRYRSTTRGGSFRAWLWSIARHKMIDALRRDRRQPMAAGGSTALHAVQNVPERLDQNDASERAQFSLLVHRALAQVRDEFEARSWEAFWRTTIDNLPTEIVASQLGMTTATVRQHRSRILRRLREQLG